MSMQNPKKPHTDLRSIMALVIPQSVIMFCHFFIGLTDVWVAGRLGADVQATLGIITQINILFITLAMATSSGVVAAISQSLGAGRFQRTQRYVTLIVGVTIILSLCMALLGFLFQGSLLTIAQTPENIVPVARQFLQISLLALPGHYLMLIASSIFRATKTMRAACIITLIVTCLNVIGDLALGLGYWGVPALGASGIAWATLLSVSFGSLCLLWVLFLRRLLSRAGLSSWRWVRVGMRYVIKVALPVFGTAFLWHSGYFVLFVITASLPLQSLPALAGLTAGVRIEMFLMVPAMACNMSAAVLVGHSLGAGNAEEARHLATRVWWSGLVFMCLCTIALWPFRETLATFITPDATVQKQTMSYLTYNLLAVPFSVTSVILAGVFNGAGATIYPLMSFGFAVWFIRLPVAYALGHFTWLEADGVYFAMLMSQIIQSVIVVFAFYRLPWTHFTLRSQAISSKLSSK